MAIELDYVSRRTGATFIGAHAVVTRAIDTGPKDKRGNTPIRAYVEVYASEAAYLAHLDPVDPPDVVDFVLEDRGEDRYAAAYQVLKAERVANPTADPKAPQDAPGVELSAVFTVASARDV